MGKQKLREHAKLDKNIVPVGQPLGIYVLASSPTGAYSEIYDASTLNTSICTEIAAMAAASYLLFQNTSGRMNGIFNEDRIIRLKTSESGKKIAFVRWVYSDTRTLTFAQVASANDTVTIGSIVYTFKATATNAYEVACGSVAADSRNNLLSAIAGTIVTNKVGADTLVHPLVTAVANSTAAMDITARVASKGSSIVIAESGTNIAFDAGNVGHAWVERLCKYTVVPVVPIYALTAGLAEDFYLPAGYDIQNVTASSGTIALSFMVLE